jgi:hypothetical protein
MLRVLLYALAILHLGPGIAFAVLAFGCGDTPWLGAVCGRGEMPAFAWLTLGLWAVMGGWAAWRLRRRPAG